MSQVGGASRRVAAVVLAAVVLLSLTAIGGGEVAAGPTPIEAGGSVNQVYVTDLPPGTAVELLDSGDNPIATGTTDAQGAFLFRQVPAGTGYRVQQGADTSAPLTVTDPDDHPDPSFYDGITLGEGYGYLPTRDGTTLSVNVHFPIDGSPGPWPVVVDYSGYDPSAPGDTPQEAIFFQVQGYVVVGVNMRGTGCSGGAFDYFETLQSTDGYDVIEAVARQSWSNGDVGMVGISYPGISQLFVAQTQPPHLDAITPLSVIADTYRSTLYPGGIRNEGFALDWASDRVDGAKPAARQWAKNRISGGDTICAENQDLRLQSRDLLAEIQPFRFYEAAGDGLSPRTFVDKIDVPVYLSGQFQDEQTGGHFSTMFSEFSSAPQLRAVLTNGTHVEPLGPEQLVSLLEFVEFYVGKRKPVVNPLIRFGAPIAYEELFGTPGASLPPDRFDAYPTYEAALAAYESEAPVKVLWENGAGRAPGEPFSTATTTHASWPPPEAAVTEWFLQPDGRLAPFAPFIDPAEPRGVSGYEYDPSTKRPSTFDGGTNDIWKPTPDLHWDPLSEGNALSFVGDPVAAKTAFAGWGSVDLWLRSEALDTDLEVTLTEVRPDGYERFIQSGWLRASHRQLDPSESTPLQPFQTHLEADAEPLPAGEFVEVRVPLFPFTHVLRPGSRLRLNIEAPGGNQPFWKFTTLDGTHHNEIAHSAMFPSKVVLPVLPSAPAVPDALPACPSIRNQPCRGYLPDRVPTDVVAADDGASALEVSWRLPERGDGVTGYRVSISELGAEPGIGPAHAVAPAAGGQLVEPAHVVDVGADVTSIRWTGAAKDVAYIATVQALHGDQLGLVSNASLSAQVGEPLPPTTTTLPATPGATGDGEGTQTTSGTLPRTGSDVGPLVRVALVLVGVGLVLALVTVWLRRRGGTSAP